MTAARKLRVAIPDSADALRLVQDGFEEITGLSVQPEFQEVDHGELIVEVLVDDPPLIPAVSPSVALVSRAVERSEFDMSVLSSWVEERPDFLRSGLPVSAVADPFREAGHGAVDRAARDELATSVWCPHPAGGGQRAAGVWQLAVPFRRLDHSTCIASSERAGYPYRFSSHDALGLRAFLEITA